MKSYTLFKRWKTKYCWDVNLPKSGSRFNVIPTQNSTDFWRHWQADHKIHMETQRTQNNQVNFLKRTVLEALNTPGQSKINKS